MRFAVTAECPSEQMLNLVLLMNRAKTKQD